MLTELEWDAVTEGRSGVAERKVLFVMLGVRIVLVLIGEAEGDRDVLNNGVTLDDAEQSGAERDPVTRADRLLLTDVVRLFWAVSDALRVGGDVSKYDLETKADADVVRVVCDADAVDDTVPERDGL